MRLYVNIDHVATLREARKTDEPDPVQAAAAAERAGADGITVHLREDRRHIQDADVTALARSVRTVLNLALGAHAIEIHAGKYANASNKQNASRQGRRENALIELRKAAAHAKAIGLAVHAGHGLTYQNVQPVAAIPEIEELNIGHSLLSNAVFWGLEEAVRRMAQLVKPSRTT